MEDFDPNNPPLPPLGLSDSKHPWREGWIAGANAAIKAAEKSARRQRHGLGSVDPLEAAARYRASLDEACIEGFRLMRDHFGIDNPLVQTVEKVLNAERTESGRHTFRDLNKTSTDDMVRALEIIWTRAIHSFGRKPENETWLHHSAGLLGDTP